MSSLAARRRASAKGHRTRQAMIRARRAPIEHLADHRATIEARHWRTYVALVDVYQRNGRATIRLVQLVAGHRSPDTTGHHLHALEHAGLVADVGIAGALRPLYVPHLPIHRTETTA